MRGRFEFLGAPIWSREEMVRAAEHFNAGGVFFEFIDAFYDEYARRLRENGTLVIAPDAQLVRVSIETGWSLVEPRTGRFLRSPGVPGDSTPYNPLGIKKADSEISAIEAAGALDDPLEPSYLFGLDATAEARIVEAHRDRGDELMHALEDDIAVVAINESDIPRMFEIPKTARAGAHLAYNHTGAYFGIDPVAPVNSRFEAARQVARNWHAVNGRWPTLFSDWGAAPRGVWATDPSYGEKIKSRQAEFASAIVNTR